MCEIIDCDRSRVGGGAGDSCIRRSGYRCRADKDRHSEKEKRNILRHSEEAGCHSEEVGRLTEEVGSYTEKYGSFQKGGAEPEEIHIENERSSQVVG